jgi:hypothetical protein
MTPNNDDVRDSMFAPAWLTSQGSGAHPIDEANSTRATPRQKALATVADEPDAANDADAQATDAIWHASLIRMLGMLDSARGALESAGAERDPATAVQIAADITHRIADFIALQIPPGELSLAVSEAVAAAGRFLVAAQAVSPTTGGKRFLGLFAVRRTIDPGLLQECMWVLRDLPLVLERYFALLGGQFRNPALQMDWIETSGTFLHELKQTLWWVEGFQES